MRLKFPLIALAMAMGLIIEAAFPQYGIPFFSGLILTFWTATEIRDHRQSRRNAIWRARRAAGHCVHCGYNLTGNLSGICPECGQYGGLYIKVNKLYPHEQGVRLVRWYRQDGEFVNEGDRLCDLETPDGIESMEAWTTGKLRVIVEVNTIMVGEVEYARITP